MGGLIGSQSWLMNQAYVNQIFYPFAVGGLNQAAAAVSLSGGGLGSLQQYNNTREAIISAPAPVVAENSQETINTQRRVERMTRGRQGSIKTSGLGLPSGGAAFAQKQLLGS